MIAERIKMLRENKQLSQSELSKKLGITRSSINAWEMGISTPSTTYLVELSQIFHVSIDYLLGLDKNVSLDITGLDTEQVRILTDLAEHFRKEKNVK
ncbi:helix-turn-helix transcriptional regulator [Agathobacter rectalis]|uniref:helix-turn-helix transcriptional regulator n=1 Tax=Agathobacter rectalis TaxID=39491 RepID=UPI00157105AE|nr:helix-turn-helix domain-containing protein [Agathobacter rectalis]NSI32596.1 helix-turn-helix transcriptional regulator [Agathobacter rectalis]NSI85472.1 helix-turn-helix transcriptional regulator [Agathobacter rectalis]